MRKLKVILMSVAVLAAVSTALANKATTLFCDDLPQYYIGPGGYYPAGEIGVTYICWNAAGICTYYQPYPILFPNYYLPCRLGQYTSVYTNEGAPGHDRGSH